ncbi:3-oxoadipate enol-lactonase [Rhodobacteraceae bacterium WD3A24]|nr:3-oxoadipate enol-lactonase [Rhodobacteraceae bacterium WD3A24]
MSRQVIEGPDCALSTRVDGAEGAPWIVLSHSLGADLSMWDPQMDLLAPHYRVLRYDTRGHGRSGTPRADWGFAEFVADVLAVMDAHGVERADFLGLSLGGMTGLGVALAHPDRIGRLVCADGRADAPQPFRDNWDDRIAKVRAGGLEAILDGTLASWLTETWRRDNPEETRKIAEMILATDTDGYVGCCAALKTLDYRKDLGALPVPALYICGEHDKGAPVEVMRDMAQATPGAGFELIADAAHLANVNNPEGFDRVLAAFLPPLGKA